MLVLNFFCTCMHFQCHINMTSPYTSLYSHHSLYSFHSKGKVSEDIRCGQTARVLITVESTLQVNPLTRVSSTMCFSWGQVDLH